MVLCAVPFEPQVYSQCHLLERGTSLLSDRLRYHAEAVLGERPSNSSVQFDQRDLGLGLHYGGLASGIANNPITPPPTVTSPLLALLLALPLPCVPLHPFPSSGELANSPPGFQRRVFEDCEKAERTEAEEEVGKEEGR